MTKSLIAHITIGVSDFKKSLNLYKEILTCLGYKQTFTFDDLVGFGSEDKQANFWIAANSPQNWGLHICFSAPSRKAVNDFYEKAIELGAKDNGKPGIREYSPIYYAAYVIDADGYRLEAVFDE